MPSAAYLPLVQTCACGGMLEQVRGQSGRTGCVVTCTTVRNHLATTLKANPPATEQVEVGLANGLIVSCLTGLSCEKQR
eukprot:3201407-Amphidinium_carterae.1